MERIYDLEWLAKRQEDERLALEKAGRLNPETLPEDLAERMRAIKEALDEPGVQAVRVFRIPNQNPRRRFPIPPRTL